MPPEKQWNVPPIVVLSLKLQQYMAMHKQQTALEQLKRAKRLLDQTIKTAKRRGQL